MPGERPAVALWRAVRKRLRPFVAAAPLEIPDRDLGELVQRARTELRRQFGPVVHVRIPTGSRLNVEALRHLEADLNEVRAIADLLTRTLGAG